MRIDPIQLSRELIAFNTINPPGNELNCVRHLEKILADAGLETSLQNFAPGRANLIARIGSLDSKPPLCFTGHVDTVPLGNTPWSVDAFSGQIIDGKMYGRGSTDMKCGVASFVAAIANMSQQLQGTNGAVLVITAGEEIGCEGAFHLARAGILGRAGAIVVAEPTSNAALVGHKGALLAPPDASTGVTAFTIDASSILEALNAAYKAARVLMALETFQFNVAPHPYLGSLDPQRRHGVRAGLNVKILFWISP